MHSARDRSYINQPDIKYATAYTSTGNKGTVSTHYASLEWLSMVRLPSHKQQARALKCAANLGVNQEEKKAWLNQNIVVVPKVFLLNADNEDNGQNFSSHLQTLSGIFVFYNCHSPNIYSAVLSVVSIHV